MALYFIGISPRQYWAAWRIWGCPDFAYPRATWSLLGDIPRDATVVLGENAFWGRRRTAHHTAPLTPEVTKTA